MSHPVLSLDNASNWQQFYRENFQSSSVVVAGRVRGHTPIPPRTIPVLGDKRILAAGCSSVTAKDTWFSGGYLTPIVACGAEVLEAELNSYRLPLNYAKLILLPDVATSYKFRFSIPYWFQDISLSIYQYVGPESDSTEDLIRALQLQVSQL